MGSWINKKGIFGATGTARPEFFLLKALVYYFFALKFSDMGILWALKHNLFLTILLLQIVLVPLWFLLHAIRLRDAGRSVAPAVGVSFIYLLAVMLLSMVNLFIKEQTGQIESIISMKVVGEFVTFSRGFSDPLGYLAWLACLALLIPPVFSIWAALQPKRAT